MVGDLFGDDAVPGTLQQSEGDSITHLKQHETQVMLPDTSGSFSAIDTVPSAWEMQCDNLDLKKMSMVSRVRSGRHVTINANAQ